MTRLTANLQHTVAAVDKRTLITTMVQQSENDGCPIEYYQARDKLDDFLIAAGAPARYFATTYSDPYAFYWRVVGEDDATELENHNLRTEITAANYQLAMDLFELGIT